MFEWALMLVIEMFKDVFSRFEGQQVAESLFIPGKSVPK
jgi:hypothetical protein